LGLYHNGKCTAYVLVYPWNSGNTIIADYNVHLIHGIRLQLDLVILHLWPFVKQSGVS
jgi:hypothetical protein